MTPHGQDLITDSDGPADASRRSSLIGRALRSAVGVDEEILREVWPERHRYTALGGVLLGTAAMATFSMGLALTTVSGRTTFAVVAAALGWGTFVFNIDRWLITSSHGMSTRLALVPRAALAIVFGIVIAEPVVLWVFDSAIEEHIATERTREARRDQDLLTRCNPTDPARRAVVLNSRECRGYVRNVRTPSAVSTQLQELEGQRDDVRGDIARLRRRLSATSDRYEREIRGQGGDDTTGRRGVGPVARELESTIRALEDQLEPLVAEENDLDTQIANLISDEASELDSFAGKVASEIDTATTDVSGSSEASSAGLLERIGALGNLSSQDRHLSAARWFLAVFLVGVDSLPVLVKMMGSKTSYDHLLYESLQAAEGEMAQRSRATLQDKEREIDLRTNLYEDHRHVELRRSYVNTVVRMLDLEVELIKAFADRRIDRETFESSLAPSLTAIRVRNPAMTRYPTDETDSRRGWRNGLAGLWRRGDGDSSPTTRGDDTKNATSAKPSSEYGRQDGSTGEPEGVMSDPATDRDTVRIEHTFEDAGVKHRPIPYLDDMLSQDERSSDDDA